MLDAFANLLCSNYAAIIGASLPLYELIIDKCVATALGVFSGIILLHIVSTA